jgi:hypothetical protein
MLLKQLLTSSFYQGEWVDNGKYRGIFIANISSINSVIAGYNDKAKKYIVVETEKLRGIERQKDNDLYNFAQLHILWFNRRKDEPKKISRRKPEKTNPAK